MVKSGVLEVNRSIDWSVFGKTSKKEIPQISVCGVSSCLILAEGVGRTHDEVAPITVFKTVRW